MLHILDTNTHLHTLILTQRHTYSSVSSPPVSHVFRKCVRKGHGSSSQGNEVAREVAANVHWGSCELVLTLRGNVFYELGSDTSLLMMITFPLWTISGAIYLLCKDHRKSRVLGHLCLGLHMITLPFENMYEVLGKLVQSSRQHRKKITDARGGVIA